jgi:hypothetical protein
LIRLSTEIAGGPVGGPYRILGRVATAALAQEQRVIFALAPAGPPWHRLWPPALAGATGQAGDFLLARYTAIEEQWLHDAAFPTGPRSLGSEIS